MSTKEPQYQRCFNHVREFGRVELGVMHSHSWDTDPKHVLFTLSRYKFVAKLLAGRKSVLEIGCADAFASRLVRQTVQELTVSDFDPAWVEEAKRQSKSPWDFGSVVHNFLESPLPSHFDGVYALDVLEHIPASEESRFLRHISASLDETGILILGTPSLQSQVHASPASKEGHVNCKDGEGLKVLLLSFFHTVFVFSMNDEIIHTGYYPMAHYLLAVGCHKR